MGVGISLSGLASAVANEGGVGVISCAGIGLIYPKFSNDYRTNSIMGLREEIRKARAKTSGVIGVNIMVALSNFADMVRTAIEEKSRHHLLRCRTAARPALVPRGEKLDQARADRLVGARRTYHLREVENQLQLPARRDRRRRAESRGDTSDIKIPRSKTTISRSSA